MNLCILAQKWDTVDGKPLVKVLAFRPESRLVWTLVLGWYDPQQGESIGTIEKWDSLGSGGLMPHTLTSLAESYLFSWVAEDFAALPEVLKSFDARHREMSDAIKRYCNAQA